MPGHWRQSKAPRATARHIELRPYLVGAAIGMLSWAAFAVAKEPLGITTALSRAAAPFVALALGDQVVRQNPYWGPMPFAWDYSMLFLVGLMGGAFVSALVSGGLRFEIVPRYWRERFGGSAAKRLLAAFVAGAAMMFGARLAGGCTSGHGISGTLQLAVSSWVFFVVLFATALLGSALVYGRNGGQAS